MSNKNQHQTPEEKAAWKAAQGKRLTCKAYKPGYNPSTHRPKPLSKEKQRRMEIASRAK